MQGLSLILTEARRYSSVMVCRKEEFVTLFIVFMNDLVKQLPTFVKSAMYADDLVMWSTEEYAATSQIRLQTAVNILSNWANK